jgi:hypothetical protein
MPRVLMNYQFYKTYTCHFVQGDARSTIGPRTRFFDFATLDKLDVFFQRCHPENPVVLRRDMRRWGRGSAWCNLTDEQYARLEQAHSRKPAPDTQHSAQH